MTTSKWRGRESILKGSLPSSHMDTATWDIATRNNKQMEDLLRKNIWLSPSSPTVDPDYVTTYEYTYENQLKQANLPTGNDTVTFQYDASGRRLKKTYTSHITIDGTPHTDVTTYKYHYAGGAITEIELDKVRDSSTTLLDQELIYHIGANSQPISFEWTRHTGTGESQTTTTSTYYYHYDVHGNTLKVTDTNQDTRITYTYDTLGNITSQTNPDSIPNPFTFMGASQTILDTETGLYFSSGYYNPQTGTLLQGTGSPAMPNPTSISTINSMSTSSLPEQQLLSDIAATSSFSPPPGSADGIANAGKQSDPPSLDYSNPDARLIGAKDVGEKNINGIICTNGDTEDGGDILERNSENLGFMFDPPPVKKNEPVDDMSDHMKWLDELVKQRNNYSDFWVREAAKPQMAGSDVDLVRRGLYSSSSFDPSMLNADQIKALKDKGLTDEDIANLMWAAFGLKFDESTGFYLVSVLGYQLSGSTPKFFFPPGCGAFSNTEYDPAKTYNEWNLSPDEFYGMWDSYADGYSSVNFTGERLIVYACITGIYDKEREGNISNCHGIKLQIPVGSVSTFDGKTGRDAFNFRHTDIQFSDGLAPDGYKGRGGSIFYNGNYIVLRESGQYEVYQDSGIWARGTIDKSSWWYSFFMRDWNHVENLK